VAELCRSTRSAMFLQWVLDVAPSTRWYVSRILWYPTLAVNRIIYAWFSWIWAMYNTVDTEHGLILGAVPLFQSDVQTLARREHVGAVLNMCEEWEDHVELYRALGLKYHREPVVDFTVPAREQLLRCAKFIDECVSEGRTVYCHCKAGRGRSTCAYLAWFIIFAGMAPIDAWTHMKASRHHISRKYDSPIIQSLFREVQRGEVTPESVRAGKCSEEPRRHVDDVGAPASTVVPSAGTSLDPRRPVERD
jgi:atypical dual specificity phosphatase